MLSNISFSAKEHALIDKINTVEKMVARLVHMIDSLPISRFLVRNDPIPVDRAETFLRFLSTIRRFRAAEFKQKVQFGNEFEVQISAFEGRSIG